MGTTRLINWWMNPTQSTESIDRTIHKTHRGPAGMVSAGAAAASSEQATDLMASSSSATAAATSPSSSEGGGGAGVVIDTTAEQQRVKVQPEEGQEASSCSTGGHPYGVKPWGNFLTDGGGQEVRA